jgi:hypothetical protein
VAAGIAVAILGLGWLTIYWRGYLVPGTPTLTRQYFPDSVLAWFKSSRPTRHQTTVDVEAVLRSAGAIEPCRNGTDLCITGDFSELWNREIERVQEGSAMETLGAMLDISPERMTTHEYGNAFTISLDDEARKQIGQWESEAAFRADVAGARVLERRSSDWQRLDAVERGSVLGGLRLFLDNCPACSGPVSLDQETVESCCSSHEVVALACEDCGSRLFEKTVGSIQPQSDASI